MRGMEGVGASTAAVGSQKPFGAEAWSQGFVHSRVASVECNGEATVKARLTSNYKD